MRIAVACCWAPGAGQGIGSAAMELAEGFAAAGHVVFYLSPRGGSLNWYERTGIRPLTVGPDLDPRAGVAAVLGALRQEQVSLVINNDHPYVQAALPGIDAHKIVICHAMKWATYGLAIQNVEWADNVVSISYDMYARLARSGVPSNKLALIHNGLNDLGYRPPPARGVPETKVKAVFAGSWSKVKGADRLLRAVRSRGADYKSIEIECYGDGPLLNAAKRLQCSTFRVYGRVERERFLAALEGADVLLLPSRMEGCPVTVIEALRAGVIPVVSDGVGAMRWMVEPGYDGYVIPGSRWSDNLWPVLAMLADNPQHRGRVRQRARQRFERQFAITNVIERMLALTEDGGIRDRHRPASITPFKWHRPRAGRGGIQKVVDRLRYRMGWIARQRPDVPCDGLM